MLLSGDRDDVRGVGLVAVEPSRSPGGRPRRRGAVAIPGEQHDHGTLPEAGSHIERIEKQENTDLVEVHHVLYDEI